MENRKFETGADIKKKKIVTEDQVNFDFFSAGGPGGRNVDTGNTGVRGRVYLGALDQFTEYEKEAFRQFLPITKGDELNVKERGARSQRQNKEAVLERINGLIAWALEEDYEAQKRRFRKPTRPTPGARERRLKDKRKVGKKKKERRKINHFE